MSGRVRRRLSSGRPDLLDQTHMVSAADERFVTRSICRFDESITHHSADAVTQRPLDRRRRQPVVDRAVGRRQIVADHLDVVGKAASNSTSRADSDPGRVHEREVVECEHRVAGEVRVRADGQGGLVERCAFVVDEVDDRATGVPDRRRNGSGVALRADVRLRVDSPLPGHG